MCIRDRKYRCLVGPCSDDAFRDRPVLSAALEETTSSSCTYVPHVIVTLSASVHQFAGEEERPGGMSAPDGDMAAFVSYDDDGRMGGTWIAERRKVINNDDDEGGGSPTTMRWEQAHVVSFEDDDDNNNNGGDQLGWSVSASSVSGTIIVGAPGYLGNDVPNVKGDMGVEGRGTANRREQ